MRGALTPRIFSCKRDMAYSRVPPYTKAMASLRQLLAKIPALLSSLPSIFIFVFLFVYLFIFGVIGLFVPSLEPSSSTQLVFGNYTNVLSALGAALAAGAGTVHAKRLKELHDKHEELQTSLQALHDKVDKLQS